MKKVLSVIITLFMLITINVNAEVPTRPEITGTFSENFYVKDTTFAGYTSTATGGGSTDMQTYSGGGTASVGVMSLDDMQTGVNSGGITLKGASLGLVSLNGTQAVDVAAGSCLIRPTNDKSDELEYLEWAAVTNHDLSGLAADADVYVYIDYSNGATVQYATSPNPNNAFDQDVCSLAEVHRTGTTIMDIHDSREFVGNHAQEFALFHDDIFGVLVTGVIASESGTRNLAISSGTFHRPGYNNPMVVAFDSLSSADYFTYWYGDGGGGFQNFTASQLDNAQYDNAGALTAITGGSWKKDFIRVSESGRVHVVYGTAEYATEQLAIDAGTPPLPGALQSEDHVRAIATWRIEELTASGTIQDDANRFTGGGSAGLSDHGSLTGLSDPDHPQYVLDAAFAGYTSTAEGGGGGTTSGSIIFLNSTGFETVSSGTTILPPASKPQITEGSPFLNLSTTPTSPTSTIRVMAVMSVSWSVASQIGACSLFKDAEADALETVRDYQSAGGNSEVNFTLIHEEPSDGGTARWFQIRCGLPGAGTFYFNADFQGGTRYGGTVSSSLFIEEVLQ